MTKQLIALGFLGMTFVSSAQTQVYYEDFDNGLPLSYTIIDNDGFTPNAATADFADAWIALPDPLDSTDTIVGSTSFFDPTGTADRWLITPQITLGAFGNTISVSSKVGVEFVESNNHSVVQLSNYLLTLSQTFFIINLA